MFIGSSVLNIILCVLNALIHKFIEILWGKCYYLHFKDEETDTERLSNVCATVTLLVSGRAGIRTPRGLLALDHTPFRN